MRSGWELSIAGTDQRHPLADGARLTVGRTADCDIRLEDQAVSRRHCTIERRGDDVVLTDLESANGTFLNERLVRSAVAQSGDRIQVGSTAIDVRGPGVEAARLTSTLVDADDGMAPVIRRRFDPARFQWLDTVAAGPESRGPETALLQRAQRHLSMLHRASEVLATARDLPGLAEAILTSILEVTRGDRAALVLRRQNPDSEAPEIAAARSRIPGEERFTVSRTLVSDVIEKGLSTFARDAVNDERFKAGASVVSQHVRSVMCVPLRTTDAILGALYVDTLSEPGRFTEADLELLAALGNQAGVALHRVRLIGELERLLLDTIRAIAATIDAKDGYTHRHSERVALLARRIAAALGMSSEEQQTAQLAALLHDVGKIAVPDSILNKPGRLTPEEFEEMKKHPLHGAQILGNIQSALVKAVLPAVRHHHERWDGRGYPEGLAGEDIPLLGRLLGVADYVDAVTSSRPYRNGVPWDEAVGAIEQQAGTHFDPHIAAVVVRLHRCGELLPPGWDSSFELLPGRSAPDAADRRGE